MLYVYPVMSKSPNTKEALCSSCNVKKSKKKSLKKKKKKKIKKNPEKTRNRCRIVFQGVLYHDVYYYSFLPFALHGSNTRIALLGS